ncbi:MAG: dihydrolipoyl dehydrogenase family protein [Sporichthyaceae bacterium]
MVGGGTAGLVAAKTAARLGARVLLVEGDRLGGDCLWTGCVPSKALLAAARAAADARDCARFGVKVDAVRIDVEQVMAHVRAAIATIEPADSAASLQAVGVSVLTGRARFVGLDVVEVAGLRIRFRNAVLATGATPTIPPIPGLDRLAAWTSDSVWEARRLPDRLAVLGGGSVGCELAQAFARLGSRVALVEAAERLLPGEDPEASAILGRALRVDGVELRLGAAAVGVAPASAAGEPGPGGRLLLADGTAVDFDRLLIALGRTPRTAGIGLAAAGVRCDERGFVLVDERLGTTNPRIRAAGDLTGHRQFTHVAGTHGALAASNAVLGLRRSAAGGAVPRVVYTDPEVAAVGARTGPPADGVRVLRHSHAHVDRAVTEARTDGFAALALDRRGRLVGATVVGPRAGESLGELTLAIERGLRARDLAGVVHPYPTYNDGAWNAALTDVQMQLARPGVRLATRTLVRLRRLRRDRRAG